jgi:tetratricopeptide (TPR) repeat protein
LNLHTRNIPEKEQEKIKNFQREVQREGPDKIAIADSLSKIYISYNQFDSAAKYLEIVANIKPGLIEFERAGNAYYEAFGFAFDKAKAEALGEKARYYFSAVLEQDPERLDIKNKLAMTYISSSNPMQGITMLREIMENDPDNEAAMFNLGILGIQSGQYERAGERFKKLVSLYPKNLQAQFYLGLCYFEMGDKDMAKKQFELVKSMEDDPAVLATIEGYLKELN